MVCEGPVGPSLRRGFICPHKRSYDNSRTGGKFSTTRGPCGRRDSIEGDGPDGELCRGHPTCGIATFSRGRTQCK